METRTVMCNCLEGCCNGVDLSEKDYEEIQNGNLMVISSSCPNKVPDSWYLVGEHPGYKLYSPTPLERN